MANDVEVLERRIQAEWRVTVPEVGCEVTSPIVTLEGQDWIFKFASSRTSKGNTSWRTDATKLDKNVLPPNLRIKLLVRSQSGSYLTLSEMDITNCDTNIWMSSQECFSKRYPNAEFSENTLKFLLSFDYGIQSSQKTPTEQKSVQTCPSNNLADRHCLESLSSDIGKLMDQDSDPDIYLKCGDCTIPAHAIILGARSRVFRLMLRSDALEGRPDSIEIANVEPEVLKVFIHYLYTGWLPELDEDSAISLYVAGDKYKVEALCARCVQFLAETLTLENAFRILAIADAHSNWHLKNRVISYVLDKNIPGNNGVWPDFSNSKPKPAID